MQAAGGRGVEHHRAGDVHRAGVRRRGTADAVEAGLKPRRDAAKEGSCKLRELVQGPRMLFAARDWVKAGLQWRSIAAGKLFGSHGYSRI